MRSYTDISNFISRIIRNSAKPILIPYKSQFNNIGEIGETVGYMVRGDSKASARTRIVFCTYGVLLRRLQVGEKRSLTSILFQRTSVTFLPLFVSTFFRSVCLSVCLSVTMSLCLSLYSPSFALFFLSDFLVTRIFLLWYCHLIWI